MTADEVRAAVDRVRGRIADAGGDADGITLVAVTKGHGPDVVDAALAAGLVDLGESYAQELLAKANDAARYHFIGRLQRNKVRSIAHLVHLWQSVDRLVLAAEIAARAPAARVLVQVNLTDDPERGGASPPHVAGLVEGARDLGLDVAGLMAVGPPGGPEAARDGFAEVVRLADQLGLPERSLGMSDDLEVAVQAGATIVRVGTALFGARPRFDQGGVGN
ncbi:MAG: dependent protein [Acidimicrobiaceae bacterium]